MSDETNLEKGTAGERNEGLGYRQREPEADAPEWAETSEEEAARKARALRDRLSDHLPPIIIKGGSLEVETRSPLPFIPDDLGMESPRRRRYRHPRFTIQRAAAINGDGQTLWAGNTPGGGKVELWLKGRLDAESQLSLDGDPLDIHVDDFLVPVGVTLPGFRPYLYRHLGTGYDREDFLIKRIRLTEGMTVHLDTIMPRIRVREGAQIWLWREPLT